ncbi:hypothetical protein Tco_0702956 [Tanacetum coccineum]|uniref:Uncharacterized protein n=1 Tax=Tanacetum coccineum TaxID=301880 RepID=A0ABQ4XYH6_9ASTR
MERILLLQQVSIKTLHAGPAPAYPYEQPPAAHANRAAAAAVNEVGHREVVGTHASVAPKVFLKKGYDGEIKNKKNNKATANSNEIPGAWSVYQGNGVSKDKIIAQATIEIKKALTDLGVSLLLGAPLNLDELRDE